jgi:hypothetical protein
MKGPMLVRKHPLYRRWCFMRQVCYNPRHADYDAYGARGIKVDTAFNEFWDFVDYVETYLGYPKPFNYKNKLARIDQADNYAPGNLKWDIACHVGRRTFRSRMITYKRKTQSLRDWSEQYNINFHTLLGRLQRGWTPAQCLGYKPGPKAMLMKKARRRHHAF